jgi:hypothetical protein
MPVIPATQEAEIRRIPVRAQPGQNVSKTLSQQINRYGGALSVLHRVHSYSRDTCRRSKIYHEKNMRPYPKQNKKKTLKQKKD